MYLGWYRFGSRNGDPPLRVVAVVVVEWRVARKDVVAVVGNDAAVVAAARETSGVSDIAVADDTVAVVAVVYDAAVDNVAVVGRPRKYVAVVVAVVEVVAVVFDAAAEAAAVVVAAVVAAAVAGTEAA